MKRRILFGLWDTSTSTFIMATTDARLGFPSHTAAEAARVAAKDPNHPNLIVRKFEANSNE
jgi:hypothetical protein